MACPLPARCLYCDSQIGSPDVERRAEPILPRPIRQPKPGRRRRHAAERRQPEAEAHVDTAAGIRSCGVRSVHGQGIAARRHAERGPHAQRRAQLRGWVGIERHPATRSPLGDARGLVQQHGAHVQPRRQPQPVVRVTQPCAQLGSEVGPGVSVVVPRRRLQRMRQSRPVIERYGELPLQPESQPPHVAGGRRQSSELLGRRPQQQPIRVCPQHDPVVRH